MLEERFSAMKTKFQLLKNGDKMTSIEEERVPQCGQRVTRGEVSKPFCVIYEKPLIDFVLQSEI